MAQTLQHGVEGIARVPGVAGEDLEGRDGAEERAGGHVVHRAGMFLGHVSFETRGTGQPGVVGGHGAEREEADVALLRGRAAVLLTQEERPGAAVVRLPGLEALADGNQDGGGPAPGAGGRTEVLVVDLAVLGQHGRLEAQQLVAARRPVRSARGAGGPACAAVVLGRVLEERVLLGADELARVEGGDGEVVGGADEEEERAAQQRKHEQLKRSRWHLLKEVWNEGDGGLSQVTGAGGAADYN